MPNRIGFVSGVTASIPSGGNRRHSTFKSCCCLCSRQSCQLCIQGAKWLPVVLIVAIVSWSYYAYIFHLCILTVVNESGPASAVILAAVYHVFLVPFLVSYWQTVFTKPGCVPSVFALAATDIDLIETASEPRRALENLIANKDLALATRSMQGEVRYCSECSHIKPDRCHHCSMCNECVLKMDHHCPWVNNCVGYYNQKFFFLFLGYAFIYCMYVMLSTLKFFIAYWNHDAINFSNGKFHVIFLFFVSGMFAISLVSLFGYHIYLISQNRTTLEAFRPPIFRQGGSDRKGFFLGKLNNFREVLGDQPILWFVPVFTSLGDGLTFPRQCQMTDEEMGVTDSDCEDFTEHHNNHRLQIRRLHGDQEYSLVTSTDEDVGEDELLLPNNGRQTRNSWGSNQPTTHAQSSPDSLVDVKYAGFDINPAGSHGNHRS